MSDVIGLADFLENGRHRGPHALVARQSRPQAFTLRDREDLDDWCCDDHSMSVCSSDTGTFAMLYQAGRPWASWGVVRQGRSILLWDCITLADIGRFPSMMDALAAVPTDAYRAPVENVIQFAAVRAR